MSLTTLDGAINDSDTEIATDGNFGAVIPFIMIDDEVIRGGSAGDHEFVGVTRGVAGSKAAAHSDNSPVYVVVACAPNATGAFVIYMNDDGVAVSKQCFNPDFPQPGNSNVVDPEIPSDAVNKSYADSVGFIAYRYASEGAYVYADGAPIENLVSAFISSPVAAFTAGGEGDSAVTVNESGHYYIHASIQFQPGDSTGLSLALFKNGVSALVSGDSPFDLDDNVHNATIVGYLDLVEGDVLDLRVDFGTQGASLTDPLPMPGDVTSHLGIYKGPLVGNDNEALSIAEAILSGSPGDSRLVRGPLGFAPLPTISYGAYKLALGDPYDTQVIKSLNPYSADGESVGIGPKDVLTSLPQLVGAAGNVVNGPIVQILNLLPLFVGASTPFALTVKLRVSNMDGTEVISINGGNGFTPDGDTDFTFDWTSTSAPVADAGTDLVWDAETQTIVSTAGGIFVVQLSFVGFWDA